MKQGGLLYEADFVEKNNRMFISGGIICRSGHRMRTTRHSKETSGDKESGEQDLLNIYENRNTGSFCMAFCSIIADFEKEYPNIKIDMQDLGWSDAEKTLQVMASSKTLPDVMYHLPGNNIRHG